MTKEEALEELDRWNAWFLAHLEIAYECASRNSTCCAECSDHVVVIDPAIGARSRYLMKIISEGEEEVEEPKPKTVVMVSAMLTDPFRGIYTQWTHYSDGTVEEIKIPKGPVIIP